MECPICYEKIEYSAIGSCTHHFCLKCIIEWCKKGGEDCPICKTQIGTIRRDIEFDKLNGISEFELENILSIMKINFEKENKTGISMRAVEMNRDDGPELCEKHNITGFPTMILLENGKKVADYNGERNKDGLLKFLQGH